MTQERSRPYVPSSSERAQRRAFEALLSLPRAVRRRMAGAPHVVDGGALDPDIALGLKAVSRMEGAAAGDDRDLAAARRELASGSWMFGGSPASVASVEEVTIDGAAHGAAGDIPAWLYRPHAPTVTVSGKHAAEARRPLALVVYFHGGRWVLGTAQTHDAVARALCAGGEVAVLNVDYRLAPEHVFPAAADDALAAYRWALAQADVLGVDPHRVAVSGDSAGGNLAAVVAQEAVRHGDVPPALQMLFVPALDLTMPRSRSYELFGDGYFLTRANMDWFEANYLGGSSTPPADIDVLRADPRVSPYRADDLPALAASGLSPAYVAVAGFDPLRDEGIAYARRLQELGVQATLRVHDDAVHPFISLQGTDLGRRCLADAVGALRMALSV